jgi:hypothetical protein
MPAPQVPVNRALVGLIALGCGVIGGGWWALEGGSSAPAMPAAFLRVGVVMAAFWLALPTRHREAAWARVNLWNLLAGLLGLVLIARTKFPLKFLIPGLILLAITILVLRPRPKTRPRG